MNYRILAIKLTEKYWEAEEDSKVWKIVKKLREKSFKKSFPDALKRIEQQSKSDMYLKSYE